MTCSGGSVLMSAEVNMGVWTLENEYCSDGFSALKYKFEEGQYDPLMIKGLGAVIFRCNSHPTSSTGYDWL